MTAVASAKATISLGSLLLNDVDENGTAWLFDTIQGWHEGAGFTVEQTQRSGHGLYSIPGRRAGRQIIVDGSVVGESRGPVEAASHRFASLLGDGSFGEFVFDEVDGGQLWANVQMVGCRIDWLGGAPAFRYQLTLLSPSPYRYGSTSSASTGFATDPVGAGLIEGEFDSSGVMDWGAMPTSDGTVTVSNPGTAPAPPVFTVEGPTPVGGFRIVDVDSGRTIRYVGGVIPTGSSLVLDASDGSVLLDGTADRVGDTIVTRWPLLAAGESVTFAFLPEAGLSAAVLTADVVSHYY